MICRNCKKEISDNAHFCCYCGTPVKKEIKMICPNCGWVADAEKVYCEECGSLLKQQEDTDVLPAKTTEQTNRDANAAGETGFSDGNGVSNAEENNDAIDNSEGAASSAWFSDLPRTFKLVSLYDGEPTVGIAKATGNLTVCSDRIEFRPVTGNAIGSSFGLAGMFAAKIVSKLDSLNTYYFRDIRNARTGKYAGVFITLVIETAAGTVLSFVPGLPGDNFPVKIANLINNIRQNGHL